MMQSCSCLHYLHADTRERRSGVPKPEERHDGARSEATSVGAYVCPNRQSTNAERSEAWGPGDSGTPEQATIMAVLALSTPRRREAHKKESGYSRYRSPLRPIGSRGLRAPEVGDSAGRAQQQRLVAKPRAAAPAVLTSRAQRKPGVKTGLWALEASTAIRRGVAMPCRTKRTGGASAFRSVAEDVRTEHAKCGEERAAAATSGPFADRRARDGGTAAATDSQGRS